MSVVSYSQVGEDLQLAYLLGKSDELTYIDIGCLWPKVHSNSFFFYERGGRGLCVDANPEVRDDWTRDRPRDLFLPAAVGAESGRMTYFTFTNPVYNTFSPDRARRVRRRSDTNPGRQLTGEQQVEVVTLDELLIRADFVKRFGSVVDFMSLDVEGLELEVLAGFNFRPRPRVIVCEHIRRGAEGRPEESPVALLLAERGYALAGYTGHDIYLMDAGSP